MELSIDNPAPHKKSGKKSTTKTDADFLKKQHASLELSEGGWTDNEAEEAFNSQRKNLEASEAGWDLESLLDSVLEKSIKDGKLTPKKAANLKETLSQLDLSHRFDLSDEEELGKADLRKSIVETVQVTKKSDEQDAEQILEEKIRSYNTGQEAMKRIKKSLDVNNFFTKIEDKWFKQGEDPKYVQELSDKIDKLKPEERGSIIEAQEVKLEDDTMKILDNLHKTNPKIYPSAEEYKASTENLDLLDNERKSLEIDLEEKFGYDVLKNSMWQKFNVKRKLAPDELKKFNSMRNAHKTITKSYDNLNKKHNKKFSEIMDMISPRAKLSFRYSGKHPELGPPRLW